MRRSSNSLHEMIGSCTKSDIFHSSFLSTLYSNDKFPKLEFFIVKISFIFKYTFSIIPTVKFSVTISRNTRNKIQCYGSLHWILALALMCLCIYIRRSGVYSSTTFIHLDWRVSIYRERRKFLNGWPTNPRSHRIESGVSICGIDRFQCAKVGKKRGKIQQRGESSHFLASSYMTHES